MPTMNPADHAAALQLAQVQFDRIRECNDGLHERNLKLESDLKKWKEHLDGEVSRRLMMEQQICGLLPVPAHDDYRPQFDRLLERLRLANDANRSRDALILRCDYLKGEVVTAGNHASCRLNVLGEIHRILGSDGSPTGVNVLTGVPPEYARLPKRIEQLLADVTTWRERYDKEVAKNGELVRENETLARNMPPEPPAEVAATPDLVYVGDLCEAWMNRGRVDGCCNPSINPDRMNDAPEPPMEVAAEPPVLIGQQWCRIPADSDIPYGFVYLYYTDAMVIRCNVFQSADGTLTYRPLALRDLPEVSAQ